MSDGTGRVQGHETVTVRYWAGARAAAGTAEDAFDVDADLSLAELVGRVLERHPGDRMARTVAVCSVLLGDQPGPLAGPRAPSSYAPGSVVELLPPFAGG